VDDVEALDDDVARERPTEQEEREVRPDDRDRQDDRVRDADAGARDQVVGERVAQEALDDAEGEQRDPMVQLSSRGLRKAPVKKMRAMWTTMAPMKMSAAQWCIWRMSSPARTAKDRLTDER